MMCDAPTAPLLLIVDDYDDTRDLYRLVLEASGFRVAEASHGGQAIELALELGPALIVMDLAMPVIDGWEATRRLKGDQRTAHVPILALTAHVDDRGAAAAAGVNALCTKPCRPADLLEIVRQLLHGARVDLPSPPR